MTDKELFNNMCPYTSRICHRNWNCGNCEIEEAERKIMEEEDESDEEESNFGNVN